MNRAAAIPSGVLNPKGVIHARPGQRFGLAVAHNYPALKGRSKRGSMAGPRGRPGPPLQGFGPCVANIPRAVPWAGADTAPLGLWPTAITRLEEIERASAG